MVNYTPYDTTKDISSGKYILRCPNKDCHARVLQPGPSHKLTELSPIKLEFIRPTSEIPTSNNFLEIKDVWDFDNIGVSKDFHNELKIERLLVCADCDLGPLGFAKFINDDDEKKNVDNLVYFINLASFVYQLQE